MVGCHLGLFFFFDHADPCLGESWKWVADSFFSWLMTFLLNSEKWVMEKWPQRSCQCCRIIGNIWKDCDLYFGPHTSESTHPMLTCAAMKKWNCVLMLDFFFFFFNTSLAVAEQTGWHAYTHPICSAYKGKHADRQLRASPLLLFSYFPIWCPFLFLFPPPPFFLSGPSFSLSFGVPP